MMKNQFIYIILLLSKKLYFTIFYFISFDYMFEYFKLDLYNFVNHKYIL